MKAKITTTTKIQITLDDKEAKWLKDLIQNPIEKREPPLHKEYREALWKALNQ